VKFLNTIVTNMLTFSRSSVPQLQLLDITGLIHETLDFMEPVFQQRTVTVSRPGREPIYIEGDRQMLWQALINLMMNSLHAMPDRGELSLQVCESQGMLVIAIDDSGIGIAPENMERIFDPFFTTNEKGTGLGLALVHQIIEKHGGAVTASSELGKGSRFTISIPVAAREVTC
jgi:signal transduction histidine kinase